MKSIEIMQVMGPILSDLYFDWLLDIIDYDAASHYICLLKKLYKTPFKWRIKRDVDRANDGKKLRECFIEMGEYPDVEIRFEDFDAECSVLEMMVALAKRCETEYMRGYYKSDRTSDWFWIMINHMRLFDFTDENYDEEIVDIRVKRMLTRSYRRDGFGGLFMTTSPEIDMRKVDIWNQMVYWLDDNYFKNLE